MLTGEFFHSVDEKGRINFPAKLREALGDSFFITRGLDNYCLYVYSHEEWEILRQNVNAVTHLQERIDLQRHLFSGADNAKPDKQGRILIPQNLREYANLDRDVVVTGASTRAEIWDAGLWKEVFAKISPMGIMEKISKLGFTI
ncbi:MAG: division/cell wall cluster transcriptional repressor MraZ [Oscillospiraceae bacterium]|nr:division/cell wall cluster transcriptional repressor MraZ [Oscillospiraceae bacterium]